MANTLLTEAEAAERRRAKDGVPSWARDPWNNGAYCTCNNCGAFYEVVRPGKCQPTCECHMICPQHGTKEEYRSAPLGHKGGGVWGWVCPECFPPCDCDACKDAAA